MDKIKEEIFEGLFIKAVHEPAYRPEFLQQLLASNVYCVGTAGSQEPQAVVVERILEGGSSIQLKSWDDDEYTSLIPFFTSLEKMRVVIPEDESFICLPAKALFEMTLGSRLVLNPQSPDATKDFIPDEIDYLLKGEFGELPGSYVIEEDTEVLIGQPADYPKFMVEQLNILLGTEPYVKAAYLAQILNQAHDDEPTLLIGLDLDDGLLSEQVQDLHSKISHVAYESMHNQCSVDLIHMHQNEQEGVVVYLRDETQPFYERGHGKKKSFFARFFS
ncbi:MAG: enhanced serine sensitivity protein SseB C-terminal domain-containing protein [Acinetobacter sp.]